MITILGAGLLGSGFVRALRAKGEDVRVWNRSPHKALAPASIDAQHSGDPAAAVRGASRTHIVVSDDAAVDVVLAAAAPGFAPGALVIDHSTTSTRGALERTAHWRERGVLYRAGPSRADQLRPRIPPSRVRSDEPVPAQDLVRDGADRPPRAVARQPAQARR